VVPLPPSLVDFKKKLVKFCSTIWNINKIWKFSICEILYFGPFGGRGWAEAAPQMRHHTRTSPIDMSSAFAGRRLGDAAGMLLGATTW
jgi:hypothetical protein